MGKGEGTEKDRNKKMTLKISVSLYSFYATLTPLSVMSHHLPDMPVQEIRPTEAKPSHHH
jgi:hypothetical protein